MSKLSEDPRIDPRIKAIFGGMDTPAQPSAVNRDELLATMNDPAQSAAAEGLLAFLATADTEEIAPSGGLEISTVTFESQPDGNTVNIQLIRPEGDGPVPLRLLHPRRRHDDHV